VSAGRISPWLAGVREERSAPEGFRQAAKARSHPGVRAESPRGRRLQPRGRARTGVSPAGAQGAPPQPGHAPKREPPSIERIHALGGGRIGLGDGVAIGRVGMASAPSDPGGTAPIDHGTEGDKRSAHQLDDLFGLDQGAHDYRGHADEISAPFPAPDVAAA
jgi:hypothetical protein